MVIHRTELEYHYHIGMSYDNFVLARAISLSLKASTHPQALIHSSQLSTR